MTNKSIYKPGLYETRNVETLKELFNESAAIWPDQPAVRSKDTPGGPFRTLTYRELVEEINALGTALTDLGLKGKHIAIIGENRYFWYLSYLAIVNGTGVAVPMDKELPPQEVQNLLRKGDVNAIIYTRKTRATVSQAVQGMDAIECLIAMDAGAVQEGGFCLEDLIRRGRELIEQGDRRYIDAKVDPDVMSMIFFTSGTTEMARGVMLSHRNIASGVVNMSKMISVPEKQGISILPLHHCYEMNCYILIGMHQGGCIAFGDGLKHISKEIKEVGVNVVLGVPLLFESIHKRIWKQAEKTGKAKKLRRGLKLSRFLAKLGIHVERRLFRDIYASMGESLEFFIVGAAAIKQQVIEDFNDLGINMIQGYGMTESSPIITLNMDRYSKRDSVGLPPPGTTVEIVDPDRNGVGEIRTKGPSVMLGYYKDPEKTAEVLRDGWLYTGDYGYLDKDHFLRLAGRKKNVIVTKNGKNIFPEEVELYLNQSDLITESMVWGDEDEASGDTVVCAEIFPNYPLIEETRGKLGLEELRNLIKKVIEDTNEKMTAYKRIRRFNLREEDFEKTTTMKIKRYIEQQKVKRTGV